MTTYPIARCTCLNYEVPEPGNKDRANRARVVALMHQEYTRSDELPVPRDLIADLMHYCNQEGIDFEHELAMATDFYGDEIA